MKRQNQLQRLLKSMNNHARLLILVMALGLSSVIALVLTHAAVSTIALQAETGTLNTRVQKIVGNSSASGGSFVKFTTASPSGGMGVNCAGPNSEVVSKQQLLCDTHAPNETPFPYTNNGWTQKAGPWLTYANTGVAHQQPGPIDVHEDGWWPVAIHTWLELTTTEGSAPVKAQVEIKDNSIATLYHYKSQNKWISKTGNGDWGVVTDWRYSPTYNLPHIYGPSGGRLYGYGVGGSGADIFGGPSQDPTVAYHPSGNPNGYDGRWRNHSSTWFPTTDLNMPDIDAIAWYITARVVPASGGSQTDVDNSRYWLQPGVDRCPTSDGQTPCPAYIGRGRLLSGQWQTLTGHTMSDAMLNDPNYSLVGMIPGYSGN